MSEPSPVGFRTQSLQLPSYIHTLNSITEFKSALKTYLKDTDYNHPISAAATTPRLLDSFYYWYFFVGLRHISFLHSSYCIFVLLLLLLVFFAFHFFLFMM